MGKCSLRERRAGLVNLKVHANLRFAPAASQLGQLETTELRTSRFFYRYKILLRTTTPHSITHPTIAPYSPSSLINTATMVSLSAPVQSML